MDIMMLDFNEKMIIDYKGEPVTLSFFALSNDQVKIGIDADKSISIYREEIYLQSKANEKNE